MKRIVLLALATLLMGLAVGASAQDVSLGDYARRQRDQKKPASPNTRVFTNDDLTSSAPVVVPAPAAPAAAAANGAAPADSAAKADDQKKDKADDAKAISEFKSKVAEQKTKIAEIKRNMDVSEREFKLHSIEWYTQAGNALLDPKKFKDEADKHNQEMADLQKQLDSANAELDKIREEIRKAGFSSSVGE